MKRCDFCKKEKEEILNLTDSWKVKLKLSDICHDCHSILEENIDKINKELQELKLQKLEKAFKDLIK